MFSNKDLTVKGNHPGFEFVPKKPTNQDVLLEKLKDVDYLVRRDMPDIPGTWFVPSDGKGAWRGCTGVFTSRWDKNMTRYEFYMLVIVLAAFVIAGLWLAGKV